MAFLVMTKSVLYAICFTLLALSFYATAYPRAGDERKQENNTEIYVLEKMTKLLTYGLAEEGVCVKDKDCRNRGICIDGVCDCEDGTSGEKCEVVDDCVNKCGSQPDVECDYDFRAHKVRCSCETGGMRYDELEKKCFSQKPCKEQKECVNGGVCEEVGEAKYCDCPIGTNGDYCENIEECIANPTLCGNGANVKCEFNSREKRAYCQCLNQNERFDWPLKQCIPRSNCSENEDCLPFGVCFNKCQDFEPCYDYNHIEDIKSCHCVEGTSGEKCQIIDDCYNKIVDCGVGENVECRYSYIRGIGGSTYCHCQKAGQLFDSNAKLCKDCDCGPMAKRCRYRKGKKLCTCDQNSYNGGDKCIDCKCGIGSERCLFKDGKVTCFCKPGFQLRNNVCEKCDCGANSIKCGFSPDGQKVCSCEDGFTQGNYSICTPMCNETHQCANGGLCLQNICVCQPGTGGSFCKTIYDCDKKMCGEGKDVDCKYDVVKAKAYCECHTKEAQFDKFDKVCKMCDCGVFVRGGECEFKRGQKICYCPEGYALNPVNNKCKNCDCGKGSISCAIDKNERKVCHCEEGYSSYTGASCVECNCGKHGLCKLYPDEESKVCICDSGYEEYKGTCVKCNCGKHGLCKLYTDEESKVCICDPGFEEYKGTCVKCNCGKHGLCKLYPDEKSKVCICDSGYEEYKGTCVRCDCGPNGKCIYNDSGEVQKCDCDSGFKEFSKKCKACDCGPFSARCSFQKKEKVCGCQKGFIDVNGYCIDYDECLDANACPGVGTVCLNAPGSFKCICESGYNKRTPTFSDKISLCSKQGASHDYFLK